MSSPLLSLEIKTIKVGTSTVHIIGAAHGYLYNGILFGGLLPFEQKILRRYLKEKRYNQTKTVALFEAPTLNQALTLWKKVCGKDLSSPVVKLLPESKATIMPSFNKETGVTKTNGWARYNWNRGDIVFRSYLHANAIIKAANSFPKSNIFIFQGLAHTKQTLRFLKDKKYAAKYATHLHKLAPKAAQLARSSQRRVQNQIRKNLSRKKIN